MFGVLGSLVSTAGLGALFGRRRGGDRHGEVPGTSDGGEGPPPVLDAFAAFADLVPAGAEAEPVGAVPFDGEAEAADDRRRPDADHGVELAAPPAWVLGELSLDGPGGRGETPAEANPDHPAELWHPLPDVVAGHVDEAGEPQELVREPVEVLAPPEPFEVVPASATLGEHAATPAPFRLNRLRHVAGPSEDPAADPPAAAVTVTATRTRAADEVPAAVGLIRGPVGRTRDRTAAGRRTVRRPAAGPTPSEGRGGDCPADEHAVTPVASPGQDEAAQNSASVPVLVAADGSVTTGSGSVRVARPEDASASSGPTGLVVQLLDHWCWAALDEFGPALVVRAGSTELHAPPGTTALVSIDDDGSQLVVVLEGEGVVAREGARIRLRRGAMAYLPVAGEPQVDVAPDDEIRSDPLVARNLRLDEHRS